MSTHREQATTEEPRATVVLFKPSGKRYTEESWRIPAQSVLPENMRHSPDFHRINGGPVLVLAQEPWGYEALLMPER